MKVPAAWAGAAGRAATKVTSRPARAASATAARVRGATMAVSWCGASVLCPAAARCVKPIVAVPCPLGLAARYVRMVY
ncbi:hypothetical protein CCE01nite_18460 [Cellulomonas cellasea]|uniref:Uncharacterized protein n=1 Tax=Cellulomonas cellasea TaxID=43670 RepID=A0A4Y3KVN2_9CELL|nr:hypothetical protein CCE01nite_18460 [Cellulomonas cellasea]